MESAYWILATLVAWCYLGYPLLVALQARFRARPVSTAGGLSWPSVVAVVAIRNEAGLIDRRLENLLAQDYPAELLRIVVVCNGTTDGGDEIASAFARRSERVKVISSPLEAGKSGALNWGIAEARSDEIVVFADARQTFAADAVRQLVLPFEDPSVGAVTGQLRVTRAGRPAVDGVRAYWNLERRLRAWESRSGSVVGATGAIYAVRRHLATMLPPNLILDDVYLPLTIAMQRRRVVMAEQAVAFDVAAADEAAEYRRKRRTMVGNIQILASIDGLLSPRRNPLLARYLSHKLMRLLSPFCLAGMLAVALAIGGPLYGSLFVAQLAVYVLGVLGLLIRAPLLSIPAAFVLIHVAIFAAVYRWKQGASDVWVRPEQPAPERRPVPVTHLPREVSTSA